MHDRIQMTRLVEIGKFDNAIDAHYMLDVLSDAGIEGDVFDENTGAAMPYIGAIGVRVVVRAEDAERARAAVAAAPPRLTLADDDEPDEADEEDPGVGEPSPTPVETWAARTRTIAFVGLGVWIVAVVALARLMSPPPGVDESPRARRSMRQARWATAIALVLLALGIAALAGAFDSLRERTDGRLPPPVPGRRAPWENPLVPR